MMKDEKVLQAFCVPQRWSVRTGRRHLKFGSGGQT
jgi:hypothetical protein